MSKCSQCDNEIILCICPKGLGGGGARPDSQEDKEFVRKLDQVATAILERYDTLDKHHQGSTSEFIQSIQSTLNNPLAKELIGLLEEGIFVNIDRTIFKEKFRHLYPNKAMLVALSDNLNLAVFPNPANQLITGIKKALALSAEWPAYPDNGNADFQQALQSYADYCKLLPTAQRRALSDIFWKEIEKIGTPIIEANAENASQCAVYFLVPKDQLEHSEKQTEAKKDLYLQGDFHGYGSTRESQKLSELKDTGIMWRQDNITKDALVVYQYIQVEPGNENTIPSPETGPFFTDDAALKPLATKVAEFPAIPKAPYLDKNSTHAHPFPGFESSEQVFRVTPDSKQAHLSDNPADWPTLLNTKTPTGTKNFVYHATLYSDETGDLHRSNTPVTQQYHNDLYYADQPNSPYADFTRDVHVFKPTSGQVDHVVVINDGIPYLMTGILDQLEQMVAEGTLSPNTAFVFIHPLPALKKTMSIGTSAEFAADPAVQAPGMGVRMVDYQYGIDQYAHFIKEKLFPKLENEIGLPDDPSHRIMIGSSASGTASIYMGVNHPELFGAVVAQSPSPANRKILTGTTPEMLDGKNIQISCGLYECPQKAAANDNLGYAKELSSKLGLPTVQTGEYGHQFRPWNDDLKTSLPRAMKTDSWQAELNL